MHAHSRFTLGTVASMDDGLPVSPGVYVCKTGEAARDNRGQGGSRHIVLILGLWLALMAWPPLGSAAPERFRIGLTPVFLDNMVAFLGNWREYLEQRLNEPVEFIHRQTYREVTEMLLNEALDAAWICGFPYVRHQDNFELLAVPLFRGEPLYQSYLIVSAADPATQDIVDLRGKVFAYSDPDSNSGYLVPQVELRRLGIEPSEFFERTFFTWAHQNVVLSVADGLAAGGAVDGYVWETLKTVNPDLVAQTRVVSKSEKFGFPPFVARDSLAPERFRALQAVMTGMQTDPQGRELLRTLNLDGFVSGDPRLFDGIRAAVRYVEGG